MESGIVPGFSNPGTGAIGPAALSEPFTIAVNKELHDGDPRPNDSPPHHHDNSLLDYGHGESKPDDDNDSVTSSLSQEEFHDGLSSDMLGALDSIESASTFANAHKLHDIVPGLVVEDVGRIDLPLQETQAKRIIAKARQAPYGKGSETIVDTSVRNTWELDASQFQLTNQHWPALLIEICRNIATEAGLGQAHVHADLYKLLIYEKGAMFKAHTDTEKIPGMFGTLVICLPSPHKGGNVVTKHCGLSKTFMTENRPQSYIWWFSDVSHEVLPVLSGYRVVLTYNLAIDPSYFVRRPSAGLARAETRPLRHTLQRWLAQPKKERKANYLYYALDHQYTEANISHCGLKTRDLAVVDVLHELSATMPIHIFLAVLQKEETGECDYEEEEEEESEYYRGRGYHYYMKEEEEEDEEEDEEEEEEEEQKDPVHHVIDEVLETTYNIQKLVDLGGQEFGSGAPFDPEYNMLQDGDEVFGDDIAEEEYEGYMGNSGPSATHWYRTAAVVIVPRDYLIQYLKTLGCERVSTMLEYISGVCLRIAENDRNTALTTWHEFYHQIFKPDAATRSRSTRSVFDIEAQGRVLLTALKMQDWDVWKDGLAAIPGYRHDIPNFCFLGIREELAIGRVTFIQVEEGLSRLVSALPTLDRQHEVITMFANLGLHHGIEVGNDTYALAGAWVRQALTKVISDDSRSYGSNDGRLMVDIAFDFFDFTFFQRVTVPMFERYAKAGGFCFGYLLRFQHYLEVNIKGPGIDDYKALYKSIATGVIDRIDVAVLQTDKGLTDAAATAKMAVKEETAKLQRLRTISPEILTQFVKGILTYDIPLPTVQKLFFKLMDQASRIDKSEFHPLWLPFLRSLANVLVECSVSLETPRHRHFYAAVLEAYAKNYIQKKPLGTPTLVRPAVNCICRDCANLNKFLLDPQQKVGRFAVGKDRRQHIHQRLDNARIDCTHITQRDRTPNTLVVTKTITHHEQALAAWKERAQAAKQQFKLFDEAQLRALLGPDFSQVTMGLFDRPRQSSSSAAICARAAPRCATTGTRSISSAGTSCSNTPPWLSAG